MTGFKIFRTATAAAVIAAFLMFAAAPRVWAGENTLNLPPAPFKPVAAGITLDWKNAAGDKSGTQIFAGNDGFKTKYAWNGKESSAYTVCLWCSSRGAEINEKVYATLWPLTVGKSVTIDRASGRGSWTNKIIVEGTEKITLAFGAIDTYRVVNKSTSATGSWEGERIYWYAPSIGWIVKHKHSDNEGKAYAWEVTGITKP